jgi:hypothetical protein
MKQLRVLIFLLLILVPLGVGISVYGAWSENRPINLTDILWAAASFVGIAFLIYLVELLQIWARVWLVRRLKSQNENERN